MKTGPRGLALIKKWEGFRPAPYVCPAGVWTIGYGTTRGVGPNSPHVREAEATERLVDELGRIYEPAIHRNVKVPLTQLQFDALVSWVYNLGETNLRNSTMLRRINLEQWEQAAEALKWWNKAGGRVLQGLVNRREEEAALFLEGTKNGNK